MRLVNAPPSVPVFCLVVTTLALALPSKVLTGTGVLPAVTVPPEYITKVAAAVAPPSMLDIRIVLPLPAALMICSSRFWLEGMEELFVVSVKKLPAAAAPLSAEASIPGAENVFVNCVNKGPFD